MISYLEFEKPVAELEQRIAELRSAAEGDDVDITNELQRLELKSANLLASTYQALSPWQKTQVARHPSRPHFRDYVEYAFDEFVPLGGDAARPKPLRVRPRPAWRCRCRWWPRSSARADRAVQSRWPAPSGC
jgi:acetyl-CoA carboxylase alpha subunit